MTKTKWRRVLIAIFLCVGIGVYFLSVENYYRHVRPLSGAGIESLSRHIAIENIKEVVMDGDVFYVVKGQLPPGYVLASGPPVYVFDSGGKLVEWIRDSGDQPSNMKKWHGTNTREIPLDRVLRNINENDTNR